MQAYATLETAKKECDSAVGNREDVEAEKEEAAETLGVALAEMTTAELNLSEAQNVVDEKKALYSTYTDALEKLDAAKSAVTEAEHALAESEENLKAAEVNEQMKKEELDAAKVYLSYAEDVMNDADLRAAIENHELATIQTYIDSNVYPELTASLQTIIDCVDASEKAEAALEEARADYETKKEAYYDARDAYTLAMSELAIATVNYEKFNVKEESAAPSVPAKVNTSAKTSAKKDDGNGSWQPAKKDDGNDSRQPVKTGDASNPAVPLAGMSLAVGAAVEVGKKRKSVRQ